MFQSYVSHNFCCKHLEDISTSKNTDTVYRYGLEQHYNPSSPDPHTNELIPLKQNLVFRRCPLDILNLKSVKELLTSFQDLMKTYQTQSRFKGR